MGFIYRQRNVGAVPTDTVVKLTTLMSDRPGSTTQGTTGVLHVTGDRVLVAGLGWVHEFSVADLTAPAFVDSTDFEASGDLPGNWANTNSTLVGNYLWGVSFDSGSFRIEAVDVSTPGSPSFVSGSTLAITPASVSRVTSDGSNYVFVSSSGDDGVWIYDVSTPTAPVLAGSVTNATTLNLASNMAVLSSSYLLVQCQGRATVVDWSTPSSPTVSNSAVISGLSSASGSGEIGVNGTVAYLAYLNGIASVDVSTPTAISVEQEWNRGAGTASRRWEPVSSTRILATRVSGDPLVEIVDVSDPTNMSLDATFDNGDPLNPVPLYFENHSGNFWVGITTDGVFVFDMSTPATPTYHGWLIWPTYTGPISTPDGGKIAVSVGGGVGLVNATTGVIEQVTRWSTGTSKADIYYDAAAGYAYTTDTTNDAIRVWDVSGSQPYGAYETGVVDATNLAETRQMVRVGSHLWVTCSGTDRVTGVDISMPTAPTVAGSVANAAIDFNGLDRCGLAYDGADHLFVASGPIDTVASIDISTPASPFVAASAVSSGDWNDVEHMAVRSGGILVVVSSGSTPSPTFFPGAISTLDISDPTNLSAGVIDSIRNPNPEDDELHRPSTVVVLGTKAYTLNGRNYVTTFDVSNEAAIAKTGAVEETTINNNPHMLRTDGTRLYVMGITNEIHVFVPA